MFYEAKLDIAATDNASSEHPGYCGAQDTFYVGNLKGVGRPGNRKRCCQAAALSAADR